MSLLQVFVYQELQVECCISCQMAKLQQSLYCLLSKLLSYPSFNSTFLTQENSNCQLRNARIHSFALYIFIILINYLFFWPSCHMTQWWLHNFLIYPPFQYSFRPYISQLLPSKCRPFLSFKKKLNAEEGEKQQKCIWHFNSHFNW